MRRPATDPHSPSLDVVRRYIIQFRVHVYAYNACMQYT